MTTTTPSFEVGPPKDYVGGHVALGIVTMLEAAIPAILYYTWQHPRLASVTGNDWWVYSWKAMTYGGFLAFIFPFVFWCLSFIDKPIMAYLYLGFLVLFGGLYGGYVVMTTIIYQFQAIRGYSSSGVFTLEEVWVTFGVYTAAQFLFSGIANHFLIDSVFYLLSAEIQQWCEEHPGVCTDYGVLSPAEEE